MNNTIVLYHGTSFESGVDIIKNGFKNNNPIWVCSDNFTYFFPALGNSFDESYLNAVSAGQIAASKEFSQSRDVCVIELEVDKDIFLEHFERDYSSESMIDIAVRIDTDTVNNLIKTNQLVSNIHYVRNVYDSLLAPFMLISLMNMSLFNEFSIHEDLVDVIEVFKRNQTGSYSDLLELCDEEDISVILKAYGYEYEEGDCEDVMYAFESYLSHISLYDTDTFCLELDALMREKSYNLPDSTPEKERFYKDVLKLLK